MVTNRLSTRLVRLELPDENETALPGETRRLMDGVVRASVIGTAIIVVVLILMVLAATGGI